MKLILVLLVIAFVFVKSDTLSPSPVQAEDWAYSEHYFKLFTGGIARIFWENVSKPRMVQKSESIVSKQCADGLSKVSTGLRQGSDWAFKCKFKFFLEWPKSRPNLTMQLTNQSSRRIKQASFRLSGRFDCRLR